MHVINNKMTCTNSIHTTISSIINNKIKQKTESLEAQLINQIQLNIIHGQH